MQTYGYKNLSEQAREGAYYVLSFACGIQEQSNSYQKENGACQQLGGEQWYEKCWEVG